MKRSKTFFVSAATVSKTEDVPGVLIVDDEASVHDDFDRHLTVRAPTEFDELRRSLFRRSEARVADRTRFAIHHCYSGEEAIELLDTEVGDTIALAFVDMRMGGGANGIETLASIIERRPQTHLVLCTAYSDFTWDQVLSVLGADRKVHLLRKPFQGWQAQRFASVLAQKWKFERRGNHAVAERR